MTDITIPPEALEAAARDLYIELMVTLCVDDPRPIDDLPTHMQDDYRREARAACLAMLKAWPGMGPIRTDQPIGDWCDKLPAIILPLKQEGE